MSSKFSNFLKQLPSLKTTFEDSSSISKNLHDTTQTSGTVKKKIVEINEVNSELEQEKNSGSSRPRKTQNTIKNLGNAKHEKEETFEIHPEMRHAALDSCEGGLEKKFEVKDENCEKVSNPPQIRECRVVLKDIKHQESFLNISKSQSGQPLLKKSRKVSKFKEQKNVSNFECKFCGRKFKCKWDLNKHLKTLHPSSFGNKLLHCNICNKKFVSKEFLGNHMQKYHVGGKSEDKFECDHDGKCFRTRMKLFFHMRIHFLPVECKICQKKMTPDWLSRHMKIAHEENKKFQCKICFKNYKSTQHLKNHEKCHNKKFECNICKKKYPSGGELNRHTRNIHDNPNGFECDICGVKIRSIANLKKHRKTHDKNRLKPFKCNRCDFATDLKRNFKNHQKSHKNQDEKFAAMKNPLKCGKCPTFCINKYALNAHAKFVHPKVLFQCDLCARFIKTKYHLIRHIKTCIKRHKFGK